MRSVLGSVSSVANIATSKHHANQDDLEQEPAPATALLLGLAVHLPLSAPGRRLAAGLSTRRVQVPGVDRDDVVVVTELASLGAEAKVGNRGDGRGLGRLEAQGPLVFRLVLQLQLQLLVLEVGQLELRRDAGVSDATGRAAGKFLFLSIVVLVVARLAISKHSHDVGENNTGAVVLVGVDKQTKTLEVVGVPEDRAHLAAVLCEPHGESIAVELVLSVNLELDFDFPVRGRQGYAGEQPAVLRGTVRDQADVSSLVLAFRVEDLQRACVAGLHTSLS